MAGGECVGTIVCKLDAHGRERVTHRGYIAMLAVRQDYRKKGIGATLSASSPPPVPHCRSRDVGSLLRRLLLGGDGP